MAKTTPQFALEIAERLGCVPEYPRAAAAMGEIAQTILECCKTTEQAEWMLREMKKLPRWPGTGALSEMVNNEFHRERSYSLERQFGPKPPGMTEAERIEWEAECERIMKAGRAQERVPPPSAPPLPMKRITADDFAALWDRKAMAGGGE